MDGVGSRHGSVNTSVVTLNSKWTEPSVVTLSSKCMDGVVSVVTFSATSGRSRQYSDPQKQVDGVVFSNPQQQVDGVGSRQGSVNTSVVTPSSK